MGLRLTRRIITAELSISSSAIRSPVATVTPTTPPPAPVFWPVTVTYGEGGTAWASAETVENGGSVEITAQPYDYYTVADVKVNGESVGAVSSYTIENITGPVAVDVSFRHANSFIDVGGQDERDDSESESDLGWGAGYAGQSLLFGDVYPWHPAYSAISFVAERGIMNGVGGGLFDPDNGVTRAMMATILWRMEGQPAAYGDTGFSDVPAGQWYSQAITWANRAGIIEGYGKGIYGLNDQVTHEQVCAMLYRWHSGGYATVDAAYAWAQSNGMYDGMSAESDEIATRGEIAQLLMAFVTRVW
ncbi:MAG: S-layer homology domain-containing protein [Ruminococcaceae bacterium]|nr:S-layer homology domain-containing protein [Oscillospiraceae bacterium]